MLGNRDLTIYQTNMQHCALQLNHCGIQECDPDFSNGFSFRSYQLIHYVFRGSGTVEINGKKYPVHANQAFYIPAGASTTYRTTPDDPWFYAWTGFFCDFRHPILQALFADQYVIDLALPIEEIEAMIFSIIEVSDERLKGITHYERARWEGPQFHQLTTIEQSLEANSRFYHLLAKILEAQTSTQKAFTPKGSYATDAKAYIDASYYEPIKISDVANALHIHPNHLTTIFKKEFKQTPKSYLNSKRMDQAARLLCYTDKSISDIAQSVGFQNPFQFSTAFKKHYGTAPGLFREHHKKKYEMPEDSEN